MRVRTLDESLRGSKNDGSLSISQKSIVSFDKLYVREFGMVLGDGRTDKINFEKNASKVSQQNF